MVPKAGAIDSREFTEFDQPPVPAALFQRRMYTGNPADQESGPVRLGCVRKHVIRVVPVLRAYQPGALLGAGRIQDPCL